MKRALVLLWAVMLGAPAQAVDVVWLKLTPLFTYKDISMVCSSEASPTNLYFGAEVEGARVLKAVLKDRNGGVLSDQISFLATDLDGIEFYTDPFGRRWLKSLRFSPRLLGWLIHNAGDSALACESKLYVKTVGPAPFSFQFEVAGLGENLLASDSQRTTFKGLTPSGGHYVATVQLTQRQY